jgi:hypothetical protein
MDLLLIRGLTYHAPMARLFGGPRFEGGKAAAGLDSPPPAVYRRGKVILLPQLSNR